MVTILTANWNKLEDIRRPLYTFCLFIHSIRNVVSGPKWLERSQHTYVVTIPFICDVDK